MFFLIAETFPYILIQEFLNANKIGFGSYIMKYGITLHYRVSKNVLYPKMQNFKNFLLQ